MSDRERAIERLDEIVHTGDEEGALIPQDLICDAALARDLLVLDGSEVLNEEFPVISLDDWPAAREFVQRVLTRHGIEPQDPARGAVLAELRSLLRKQA